MAEDLDAFLRKHGGLEGLGRKLGQDDPAAWRWKPRANDNRPVKPPATRLDLFVGFALGSAIGAAAIYVLFFR